MNLTSKINWKYAPINYEWNNKIASNILYTMEGHSRLKNTLNKMGYKASIGLAASLLKLVLIRLDGHPELSKELIHDINNRIDSVFSASVNPLYSKILKYGTQSEVPTEGPIHGPCFIILNKIMHLSLEYNLKRYFIHRHLVGSVLLLNHISPNNNEFNEWITKKIQAISNLFPCKYSYASNKIGKDDEYDCSNEPSIPQEFFFDEDFQYTPEAAKLKINIFLHSLNYRNNPHLRSPEEMLEAGFKGIPYTL
jgi:hypothetical protein